jgi:Na+/proline symporter
LAGPAKTSERSISLFLLGALAFSPPLLLIFSDKATILGIPSLYAYLFSAWIVLIVLVRILAERARPAERPRTRQPPERR